MANILNKWLRAPQGTQIILAFLYVLVALGIPLNHTCHSGRNVYHCHLECPNHQLADDCYATAQHAIAFNQNNLPGKTEAHSLCCPVCLYLLISKAFRFCSNASLCSTQTAVRTQVLPQLSFTKQLEWFCSNPLRAPPFSIS